MIGKHFDPAAISLRPAIQEHTANIEQLIALFIEIFPEDASYADYIRRSAAAATPDNPTAIIHQWLVTYHDEPIGFRLFNYLRRYNLGFSRYLGLTSAYRGLGIGRYLHEQTIERLKQDAASLNQPAPLGFCGEVDHPAGATIAAEKKRREERIAIYQRLGATLLDIDYYEPTAIQGVQIASDDRLSNVGSMRPDQMYLYFVPFVAGFVPTKRQMGDMVTAVLVDNYGLAADSWYVKNALKSL
ncbi:MAG: GNAT family N-acetyltransferase [Chloroflexota bacterium]